MESVPHDTDVNIELNHRDATEQDVDANKFHPEETSKKDRHVHILQYPTNPREDDAAYLENMTNLAKLLVAASRERSTKKQEERKLTKAQTEHYEKARLLNMSEVRGRLQQLIRWSDEETAYIDSRQCRTKFCDKPGGHDGTVTGTTSVTRVLRRKLEASPFGGFLLHLNAVQRQEQEVRELKLEIAKHDMALDRCEKRSWRIFHEGVGELLKEAVALETPIDLKTVQGMVTNIRLDDCKITQADKELARLKKLRLLSLSGNWLTEVQGNHLPRTLLYLDLYGNRIADVASLAEGAPRWMLHLGLARNRLTDESHLNLVARSMQHLRSLSLENNDICDLMALLCVLHDLPHLCALALQGNPCSTCVCYREAVLDRVRNLQYLDNVEVWPIDRHLPPLNHSFRHLARQGRLLVTCHRVMGIPEPPALTVHGRKVVTSFVFEVEVPLLDPALRGDRLPEMELETDVVRNLSGSLKSKKSLLSAKQKGQKGKEPKDKTSAKPARKTNTSRESVRKKGNKESQNLHRIYSAPFADKTHLGHKSSWFSSEAQPWSKLMRFPSIQIPAPDDDLTLLRDTFRSIVCARLVVVKTLPPPGKVKAVNKSKSKKGEAASSPPPQAAPPTEEIQLSRSTIAKFGMSLASAVWCDVSQDFDWAMGHDGSRPKMAKASPVGENLWDRKYEDPNAKVKGKKGGGAEKKAKKGGKPVAQEWQPPVLFLPTVLTCHVGVGLERVQIPVHEISVTAQSTKRMSSTLRLLQAASDQA